MLMMSRFQNCHWESNLTKNSWRIHQKWVDGWMDDQEFMENTSETSCCKLNCTQYN